MTVIDGGFIANNATLFSIIDAHKAFERNKNDIRILNVGVGQYIEKASNLKTKLFRYFSLVKFVERVLSANTNTNVIMSKLLYPNLKTLRISESFPEPEYGTNITETNIKKLKKLIQLGRSSFAKFEKDIDKFLEDKKA
jgi:predicted patatin/cPLA2 family phospholipase